MTLVASCCTTDFVLQVSDRRLTFPNGSVAEDDENKAVFLSSGPLAFSYTGLARLPSSAEAIAKWPYSERDQAKWLPTHCWLGEQLSLASVAATSLDEIVASVRDAATAALKVANSWHFDTRQAFLGIGHIGLPELGVQPLLMTFSNFEGDGGEWLSTPRDAFRVSVRFPPQNKQSLVHFSSPLPEALAGAERAVTREVESAAGVGNWPSGGYFTHQPRMVVLARARGGR